MSSQVSECQGENEKNDLYYMYNFISIGLKKEIQRVKLDGRRNGLQKYILRPMMTWRHPGITWHIILMTRTSVLVPRFARCLSVTF